MKAVLMILWSVTVHSLDLDNGIEHKPEVNCGIDKIFVDVETVKPFTGRLFVQGEADNSECVKIPSDSSTRLSFVLPIGACNMRRQRTMRPRGVSFSFTLVISFHRLFVTGVDRSFHIKCFFLESVKSLDSQLGLKDLTTEVIEQQYQLPDCYYDLTDGTDDSSLKYAQVGQRVTHKWTCNEESSAIYGFLIHSCYTDDGQENKFELVDDRGCSTDTYLLPHIHYDENKLSASTTADVFKYADKGQLYFTCTVQLCYKHDGGCDGMTPPSCSSESRSSSKPTYSPTEDYDNDEEEDSHETTDAEPSSYSHSEYRGTRFKDSPMNGTYTDVISLNRTGAVRRKGAKKRRDSGMESDLSVGVIVLPIGETSSGTNFVTRVANVCVTRFAAYLSLVAAVITIALCSIGAYLLAKRSNPYDSNMDAF
ncbi:unnamed protein product [Cylicocyclus nassatus]|uniref:ZP domain-containing protein n=1 Tax=Cylicocyclus nassatus TaxID=53992 RepID=A0AA36M7B5_CYLNA|nr:unnamed protein product [Cylicocyclus nassatus]